MKQYNYDKFTFTDKRFLILEHYKGTDKETFLVVPCEWYENAITAHNFFNQPEYGYYETIEWGNTPAGKLPVKIIAKCKTEKSVREYKFIPVRELHKHAGNREKFIIDNCVKNRYELKYSGNRKVLTLYAENSENEEKSAVYDLTYRKWVRITKDIEENK